MRWKTACGIGRRDGKADVPRHFRQHVRRARQQVVDERRVAGLLAQPRFDTGGVLAGPPRLEQQVDVEAVARDRSARGRLRCAAATRSPSLRVAPARCGWWRTTATAPARRVSAAEATGSPVSMYSRMSAARMRRVRSESAGEVISSRSLTSANDEYSRVLYSARSASAGPGPRGDGGQPSRRCTERSRCTEVPTAAPRRRWGRRSTTATPWGRRSGKATSLGTEVGQSDPGRTEVRIEAGRRRDGVGTEVAESAAPGTEVTRRRSAAGTEVEAGASGERLGLDSGVGNDAGEVPFAIRYSSTTTLAVDDRRADVGGTCDVDDGRYGVGTRRQVRPVAVDEDQVGAFAELDRSDLALRPSARAPSRVAICRTSRAVSAPAPRRDGLQAGRQPHLLEHVELVVAGRAVGAQRHRDAAPRASRRLARCPTRASGSIRGSAAP